MEIRCIGSGTESRSLNDAGCDFFERQDHTIKAGAIVRCWRNPTSQLWICGGRDSSANFVPPPPWDTMQATWQVQCGEGPGITLLHLDVLRLVDPRVSWLVSCNLDQFRCLDNGCSVFPLWISMSRGAGAGHATGIYILRFLNVHICFEFVESDIFSITGRMILLPWFALSLHLPLISVHFGRRRSNSFWSSVHLHLRFRTYLGPPNLREIHSDAIAGPTIQRVGSIPGNVRGP